MRRLRTWLRSLVVGAVGRLPAGALESLLVRLAAWYTEARPPEQALRFLLSLDNRLYSLQGRLAIAYGGGEHTKHRHTGYHDFFVARVRPGQRVLDVGCGSGALAEDLARRAGAQVVGVDQDRQAIARARREHAHPQVEYRQGRVPEDLPGERFQVVVLSNLLEHLPRRVEFLREVVERLQPERLLVRVPLYERDWRVPLKQELGLEWRADPTHHTEYTLESFAAEMAAAGLEVVEQMVRWGEIWAEVRPR